MNKPVLIVMAAGMGSRYGGLKQMDPVGSHGQLIIDYAIYDAKQAGFETVVCIVSEAIEDDFKETIGKRLEGHINVKYAVQRLCDIPSGFSIPEGRVKPWGTSQAIYAAADLINGPCAVINADDYYGPQAFKLIYDYLTGSESLPENERYAMAGYLLKNTVTEHGHVARGVCAVDSEGCLTNIHERTQIQCFPDGIKFTEDEGATWQLLSDGDIVSMNFWGFPYGIMREIEEEFPRFLNKTVPANPLKSEFYIPELVGTLVRAGKVKVKVLSSTDKWYGVTYKADKESVVAAIAEKTKAGQYPDNLWP